MKAKKELIKLVLDNDFITAPRLRTEFRSLLDRVEIEAQAEFKNCNIPHVVGRSEQLVCDCTHTQACKICAKSKGIDWDDSWDEAN